MTDQDGFTETPASSPLDRRQFLKIAGSGVFILFSIRDGFSLAQERGGQRGYPDDINAYLRIGEDGRVTCYSGKIEMGQANTTALAQMIAEELEVPFDAVSMLMGDTRSCPWDGGTNGSRSIKYFGPALRAAGAEAREVLIELAADSMKLPRARLRAENFDTYRITRFSQVPEIQTVIVDNPDLAPQGCGEPTITCMAALLANALFDRTGVRLSRLPLSPERVKEALRSRTTPTS